MHVDLNPSCVPSLFALDVANCAATFWSLSCWQEANATCISSEAGLIIHAALV